MQQKNLYRRFKNSTIGYIGCSEMTCEGERIHPFEKCIAHLSSAEQEEYLSQLRGGAALVISSVEVDANFVHQWIDRISISNSDGTKEVPNDIIMQGTKMVDTLQFEKIDFRRSVNLMGLNAYAVRIFNGSIAGQLSLDSMRLKDELSLQGLQSEL